MTRWPLIFVACVLAITLGWWASDAMRSTAEISIPDIAGNVYTEPVMLNEFDLIYHNQQKFSLEDFKDQWTFVMIGYTYCPDICPLTLFEFDKLQKGLASSGVDEGVRYVFISVDPARDSPQRLQEYVEYFNPKIMGASGSDEAIAEFTRQLNMVYFLEKEDKGDKDYLVSHSSTVALIDPEARFHAVFTPPLSAQAIEEGFKKILRRWEALNG